MTKGVVILGVPRSGTTLLRRLFDAHPSFACPGETFVLTAAARFLFAEPVADGLDLGVESGLAFAGFTPDEVVARLREFVFAFHREHAARAGKPRWAEKSTPDVFHLPDVERLCGDGVQYVCIVRNASDAILSLTELPLVMQRWQQELHAYVARYARPYEAMAHAWVDGTEAMLDLVARRPADACMVRYEDLVADPAAAMGRVMDHLGETWPSGLEATALSQRADIGIGDWKTYGRPTIDASSVGRHKSLSRVTIHELAAIVNATLERCGYDRLPEGARPSSAQARRLMAAALKVQPLRRR